MDLIFKRLPLLLAFTCEMREPGDYKSVEVAGVPVLIVRGQDGLVRAFIGVCSHRGTVLTENAKGRCEQFTCPYHGWTYNDRGALVGVAGRRKFGDIVTASRGLTELPSVERAGMIFVSLTPGAESRCLTVVRKVLLSGGNQPCPAPARRELLQKSPALCAIPP
jgi:phenylpropionate dioxygenase-like ring-hydroxylating dioxygenase large terminal subunit